MDSGLRESVLQPVLGDSDINNSQTTLRDTLFKG